MPGCNSSRDEQARKEVNSNLITCSRTIFSTSRAVLMLWGWGMPCVMIVDSSATTGRLFIRASYISGLISTRQLLKRRENFVAQLINAKWRGTACKHLNYLNWFKSLRYRLWLNNLVDIFSNRWYMFRFRALFSLLQNTDRLLSRMKLSSLLP